MNTKDMSRESGIAELLLLGASCADRPDEHALATGKDVAITNADGGVKEEVELAPAPRPRTIRAARLALVMLTAGAVLGGCGSREAAPEEAQSAATATQPAAEPASAALVAEGQRIFRFDTFGDEQVWTDKLGLHEVVEKSVDRTTALKVGLKVDADALPPGILEKVDLNSAISFEYLKSR